jgi:hypothetical protein
VLGVVSDEQLALAVKSRNIDAAAVRRLVVDQHHGPTVVVDRGVLVVGREYDLVFVLRDRLPGADGGQDREPARVGLDRAGDATDREGVEDRRAEPAGPELQDRAGRPPEAGEQDGEVSCERAHATSARSGRPRRSRAANRLVQTATTPGRRFPNAGPGVDYAFEATLATATDVDVYRIRAPKTTAGASVGPFSVVAWATTPQTIDPVITIRNEFGVTVPATIVLHDGGAFAIQVANAISDEYYFIEVRHNPSVPITAVGNYAFGVKFGDALAPRTTLSAGVVTEASPVTVRSLTVAPSQVSQLILHVGQADTTQGIRFSILDANDRTIVTRFARGNDTVTASPFLSAGTYRLIIAGGSTVGGSIASIPYELFGYPLTDPIGPRLVAPNSPPSPPVTPSTPPPVAVGPGVPNSPVLPTPPNSPNWWITPPTDWPAAPGTAIQPTNPPASTSKTASVGLPNGIGARSYRADGSLRLAVDAFPGFTGEVRIVEADLNGDGVPELIAGNGAGRSPLVRVFDGKTGDARFEMAPFEASFQGGIYLAAGDLTGDGIPDLAIAPDEGGGPRVRILSGRTMQTVADFYGIDDPNFRGGARPAIGDLNGDGFEDLIVAAGFGGGPRIAIYSGPTLASAPQKLINDFFLFESTLRNGAFVAAGDLDGDGYADLIGGGGPGGGPRVYALSGKAMGLNQSFVPVANFFAGNIADRGGIRIASRDVNGDGFDDILTGSGPGSSTIAQLYSGQGLTPLITPIPTADWRFPEAGTMGVFVG